MAINWGKKKEYQITTDYVREHLYEGKVMDEVEYFDKMLLYRQLQIMLPMFDIKK